MALQFDYDFCVIGGGSAGYAAATIARALGKKVVIVESLAPLGGLCILRGCMPSKTLLRSAEVAHLVAEAPKFGIETGAALANIPAIVARKRRIIKEFADYRVEGIDEFPVLRGSVSFIGPDALMAGHTIVRAEKYLVATGSVINIPQIPGLVETGFLTSDDVLDLDVLPRSVIVLGGGLIACELAQYLQRVGVEVTLLQRGLSLLSREDPDVGFALQRALVDEGTEIRTGVKLIGISIPGGRKRVQFDSGGDRAMVEADEIFVALGRRANVDGLELASAGVRFDRRGVHVDASLRTTNPNIYAAGDVVEDSTQLVHVAVNEGQTAARNAFSDVQQSIDYELHGARAVFTDPQVAVAGLTERECKERSLRYAVARFPFDDLGKAIAIGETKGFVKMLAAPDGTILGVAIVGAEASDLIHESIALLYFKANVRDVMRMPHLHPTLAEILTYPAEELCERLEHEQHALVQP
ncbi:MAG TPA: FAD-dependent oxidoreductase [Candidatus Eremiobacteraceae bacterium]|nr:FAD-dependent oxidoreductase [Candidatus Eremiobacteraceae bacterium]